MNEKITLRGQLEVLVEETEDGEDVTIKVFVGDMDIWSWLKYNKGENVKITLEKLKK